MDFLERLVIENRELNDKVSKLRAFIISEAYEKLDLLQKQLLKSQLLAMNTYAEILSTRLATLSAQLKP